MGVTRPPRVRVSEAKTLLPLRSHQPQQELRHGRKQSRRFADNRVRSKRTVTSQEPQQQMRIPEGAISGHRGLGPKSLKSFSVDKRLSANGRHLQLAQNLPNPGGPLEHLQNAKTSQTIPLGLRAPGSARGRKGSPGMRKAHEDLGFSGSVTS